MHIYELENIAHAYDGRTVLSIDQWDVESGMVTGVVGPNGSGKSTLLTLLGFVIPPTQGRIIYKGRSAEPFSDQVRGRVAMLPQDAFLLKRTVYGNISYGLRIGNRTGQERENVHAAMDMVGLEPGAFSRRPWFALSGGEARRVALAARLALKPEVLLMDEPTVSVDAASAQLIKEAAVHARQQWGTTLIISSHDTEWLADISDRFLHLFRGRMLGTGKQTLVFGPWSSNGNNMCRKTLAEGQIFEAYGNPPDPHTAVAALEANRMRLYLTPGQTPSEHRLLKGILLRLSFEQSTRLTGAAILIGDMVFNAYLPQGDAAATRFSPGQEVWIGYNPHSVAWF